MKRSKRYIKKHNNKSLINKKVLNKIINNSNICKHAVRELNIAGFNNKGDTVDSWIYNQVIEAVAVFASHGNSGFSAGIESGLVNKLCKFEVISPLTFKDDEWDKIDTNCYQNNRCGHIFKNNGRIYNINAYTKEVIRSKYFGKDEFKNSNRDFYFNGGFFVTQDDILTGEYINGVYIKDCDIKNGVYVVRDAIKLKATEIEIAKGYWFMTVEKSSTEMLLLGVYYDIEPIFIDSIKDIHIKDLTYEQLSSTEKYIIDMNKVNL